MVRSSRISELTGDNLRSQIHSAGIPMSVRRVVDPPFGLTERRIQIDSRNPLPAQFRNQPGQIIVIGNVRGQFMVNRNLVRNRKYHQIKIPVEAQPLGQFFQMHGNRFNILLRVRK